MACQNFMGSPGSTGWDGQVASLYNFLRNIEIGLVWCEQFPQFRLFYAGIGELVQVFTVLVCGVIVKE
jgi:hypothetical protein